jgi:catechol 2,3-dioxygenase-like lactoylglutathione lyase family enzyme
MFVLCLRSRAFYTRLFGVSPHKQRPGYANFAVTDPPLKLVLIENPGAEQRLNHLGVEAPTPDLVIAALARFQGAELATTLAEQDVCCHAMQDQVFVTAPDGPIAGRESKLLLSERSPWLQTRGRSASS